MINNNKKIDIDQLKKSVVQINVLDKNNETIAVGSGVVAFENNLIMKGQMLCINF